MFDIAANYQGVMENIRAAATRCGKEPHEIKLLAAFKSQDIAEMRAAARAGIRLFGENYVQEAKIKRGAIEEPVEWHMIGHLQRNKVKAALFRLLKWKIIRTSLEFTAKTTGMVFFIIMNSTVFSQLLAYSGATAGMLQWAASFEIPSVLMLLLMFGSLLLLGMFIDPVSMMLISIPIFFPLAQAPGSDPVWFGIFVLLSLEMSGTTPPFGLLLFIMLGVAPKGTTLFQVANAAFPFLICDAILISLLLAYP